MEDLKTKKIFFFAIVFISFSVFSCCFGADETVTTAGKPLSVEEFTGTTDTYLEPTMFPNFYKDTSENPKCADYLMTGGSKAGTGLNRWTPTPKSGTAKPRNAKSPYGVSGSPFKDCSVKLESGECNYSNCAKEKRPCDKSGCSDVYFPCKENGYNDDDYGSPIESREDLEKGEYQGIPGLGGIVKTAKGYRNITKILFTWTVRVEGYQRLIAVWPFICHGHHGTSYQEFPAGQLKTQLYVKGVDAGKYAYPNDDSVYDPDDGYYPVGPIAEMTIPTAGKGKVANMSDPTITGSFALLPSDFLPDSKGKGLPEKVEFEVRWYNETSMRIKSPANQRNLIATVFPVTNQESKD